MSNAKTTHMTLREVLWVSAVALIFPVLVYIPFLLHLKQFYVVNLHNGGMFEIFKNWDGPHYVLNAITLYDPKELNKRLFLNLPVIYYSAHYPLYPFFIRLFSFVGGYLYSAVFVNVAAGVIANILLYKNLKSHTKHALWLTVVFTVFPPRFLIMRTTIAPEMMLLICVILLLEYWQKKNYLIASLAGIAAVWLKFQALFFILPLAIYTLHEALNVHHPGGRRDPWGFKISLDKDFWLRTATCFAILFGFLGLCLFYYWRFGDFFAYFKSQSTVSMGAALPFSQFDWTSRWVSTGWIEEVAIYWIGLAVLCAALWEKKNWFYFYFCLLYGGLITVIPQRDVTRLLIPLAPIFIYTFQDFFQSKTFKIGLIASHTRAIIHFTDNSQIYFDDARKFGWVAITDKPIQYKGVDVMDAQFIEKANKVLRSAASGGRKIPIISFIMDQSVIAGVGNIYANDALYLAKIHPIRPVNTLTEAEIKTLINKIYEAIQEGIARKGSSKTHVYRLPDKTKGSYQEVFKVYSCEGQPCAICQTTIKRSKNGGRSFFYCERCQKI